MTMSVREQWEDAKRRGFTAASLEDLADAMDEADDPLRRGLVRYVRARHYPMRDGEYWWWLSPPQGYEALSMHQVPNGVFDKIKGHANDGASNAGRKKGFSEEHEAVWALIVAYAEAHPVTYPPALKVGQYVHWRDETYSKYRCGRVISTGEEWTTIDDFDTYSPGVHFVKTPLLVPGVKLPDELRKMTAEAYGEGN